MKRLCIALAWSALAVAMHGQPFMPEDHLALTKTISYEQMKTLLASLDGKGPVAVPVEAQTAQGRAAVPHPRPRRALIAAARVSPATGMDGARPPQRRTHSSTSETSSCMSKGLERTEQR